MNDYNGVFPHEYDEILKLKGVGKYTAAAVSSICFDGKIPAVTKTLPCSEPYFCR
jgi:A/G-specific adenine glycosylase